MKKIKRKRNLFQLERKIVMNTPIGKSTLGEMLPLFIFMGIMLLIIIFCIRMFFITSKAKNRQKQEMNKLKKQGLTIYATLNHINGLPLAENLLCEVFSYPDRIEFKAGTTSIKLAREKITDMCLKFDTEIQNQMVSSIGGAIAGGVMFGTLGAIIGGRAKNKKVKTTTQYLIITYTEKQAELKYIGFDTKNNPSFATKLVKEFHELNRNSGVQIEL